MDRKLEQRIAKLERALKVKNEMKNPAQVKADAINSALTTAQSGIYDLVRYINAVNGKGVFDYSDEVMDAIAMAKNRISQAENILLDIYPEL
jgi:hypothetical protein